MNPLPSFLIIVTLHLLLVGCGEKPSSQGSESPNENPTAPSEDVKPEEPVAETKPTVISGELLTAVKNGDEEAVHGQLADDANIAGVDENGATVLHHAALEGHHDIIEMLLKAGGNVNAQMRNNNTPLHMAIFGGANKDTLLQHASAYSFSKLKPQTTSLGST